MSIIQADCVEVFAIDDFVKSTSRDYETNPTLTESYLTMNYQNTNQYAV